MIAEKLRRWGIGLALDASEGRMTEERFELHLKAFEAIADQVEAMERSCGPRVAEVVSLRPRPGGAA